MLSAAYDGKDSQQTPTLDYLLYRWRREMRVSYQEMASTPFDVLMRDMEYISIERTIERSKSK